MFSKSCFNFDRKVQETQYERKIFSCASMKRKTTERVKICAKVSQDFHIIISFSAAEKIRCMQSPRAINKRALLLNEISARH